MFKRSKRTIALLLAAVMVFSASGILPAQAINTVNITPQNVSLEAGGSIELTAGMPVIAWEVSSTGAPMTGVTITPIPMQPSNADTFERQVFDLTNAERAAYGLEPLIWHYGLAHISRLHSLDMALNNFMSHDSFDGRTFSQRIDQAGINWSAIRENVAAGQQTPQAVVNAWMNSPGHRANILAPNVTHLGVGFHVNGLRWTQKFATTTTPGDTPLPLSMSATLAVAATAPVGTELLITATNAYGGNHTITVTIAAPSSTVVPTPPPAQPTPPPASHNIFIWDGGENARSNVPHAPAGQTIIIDAGLTPEGFEFSHWTTSPAALNINFAVQYNPITTFVMPNEEVNLVVIWQPTILKEVLVWPATSSITRGRQRQFMFNTIGSTTVPQGMTWSIVGGDIVEGTYINADGLLTIARSQPFTTLTIRATSTFDSSIYGEATIRVTSSYDTWTPAPFPTPTPDDNEVVDETPSVSGVDVDLTFRNSQVVFNITVNEARRIITASNEVVVINVTGTPYSVVQLPTNIVSRFATAELGLEVQFAFGTITLDAEALYSLANQVTNRFITISLVEMVVVEDLLQAQQNALEDKDVSIFQVRVNSGLRVISEFDGELVVSIIYVSEEPVYVWLLDNYGSLELLELLEPYEDVELEDNEHLLIFVAPAYGFVVIGN